MEIIRSNVKKKVLIVVDMQKGFMTKPKYQKLAEKIDNLLLHNVYELIIFTKFINDKNSLYETKIKWTGLQDSASQDFAINLLTKNVKIFKKHGYGLTDEQIEFIKSLKVKSVDICGLQTEACVYAISFQLFDNKIFPNILINYCQSAGNSSVIKKILIHQFGKVDERG